MKNLQVSIENNFAVGFYNVVFWDFFSRVDISNMCAFFFLVSFVDVVHSSECQINSFFFTIYISGQTMQPVFLSSTFHNQQRPRKQGKSDKIWRSIFSSKFKHSYSSKRHQIEIKKNQKEKIRVISFFGVSVL